MNFFSIGIVLVLMFSGSVSAREHAKDKHPGEYYEMDVHEGKCSAAAHYSKRVVTAPYHGTVYVCRKCKRGFLAAIHGIERFLQDTPSGTFNRQKLQQDLNNLGADFAFETFYEREGKEMGSACCFGVPKASSRALKRILLTVGFTFPRATWRTIKNLVHGTRDCVGM